MTIVAAGNHTRSVESDWTTWIGDAAGRIELTATRITLIYAVFGMVALFLSDVLFVQYFSEPLLSRVQAVKGAVEVVLTAGLIFVLTHRSRRQLQAANERVERQRDELRLLHRVFRHNLRNNLNVISGNADLINREASGKPIDERCQRIIETCEQILAYTEKARRIRKVTGGDGGRRTVDLAGTIHQILDEHPRVNGDLEVTTAIPAGTEVEANPMLEEAIRELVTNAIKHNDAESLTVTIDLVPQASASRMATVRIRDNGPGIPDTEIESLHRDRETQLLHSTGMGLWFVDWVVSHSGGELDIEREPGRGTDVYLRLPIAPTPRS